MISFCCVFLFTIENRSHKHLELIMKFTHSLALFASASLAVVAQEQSEDPIVVFGEIDQSNQVGGLRSDTPLIDTPRSVTVFTKEQIEEQGIRAIDEIVDYTPGVTTSQGEGHRDAIVFRGVRSTADFFIDGVRDDVQYFRSLYNVEKVELLKGPSALHFGRGGTGGVLNRVLKKARIGEDFNEYQLGADTFGGFDTQFDFNQSLGDKAAFRLNAFQERLNNHRDFFEGDRFGINPSFKFQLTEDTTLDVDYEHNNHERFIDRGIPSENGRPVTRLAGTTFGDSELNLNELESHTLRAVLKHNFDDNWKASLTGFYGTYDKVYTNYFASDFRVNGGVDEVEIDGYRDTTDRQNFVLSGDLVGDVETFGINHSLVLGAEYTNTSSDQDRLNNVWASNGDDQQFFAANGFRLSNGVVRAPDGSVVDSGTFSDLNDDTEVTINTYSFFLQDEIEINQYVDLIAGLRFDSFDIEVDDNRTRTTASRRDNEVTPRLGIVVKPVEELSLYASYSETFLPGSGEQFANVDERIEPTGSENFEIGLKWNIRDNLNLSLAAFQIEQSAADVDDNNNDLLIINDSEITGFEAGLNGNITDRWSISAGFTYLDGDLVDAQSSNNGNRLRELPEYSISLWNNYQLTEKLNVGFGFVYQDESFADTANTTTLPSYVRFDAAASYRFSDTLRVQVNIENLFDRDYFPNSHTANNISVGESISARFGVVGSF